MNQDFNRPRTNAQHASNQAGEEYKQPTEISPHAIVTDGLPGGPIVMAARQAQANAKNCLDAWPGDC